MVGRLAAVGRACDHKHESPHDARLLRFAFAVNQVNEMLAAGPPLTEHTFKNKAQRLLEAALKATRMRFIPIAKDGVKLAALCHEHQANRDECG